MRSTRRWIPAAVLLAMTTAGIGQAPAGQTAGTAMPEAPVMPSATPPGGPGTAPPASGGGSKAAPSYILGAGDRVRITVFGEDRLSGEYVVTSNGELSFPLIGNIKTGGLSVADLQSTLRAKLASGYLKDPRVAAEVLIFRPFYVLGEVARPGQYPYVDGLTVQQAIATAGGYTYRAKRNQVYLRRPNQPREQELNLKKEPLKPVSPGDTIRVGERFF